MTGDDHGALIGRPGALQPRELTGQELQFNRRCRPKTAPSTRRGLLAHRRRLTSRW
jgi:hypothetical protein